MVQLITRQTSLATFVAMSKNPFSSIALAQEEPVNPHPAMGHLPLAIGYRQPEIPMPRTRLVHSALRTAKPCLAAPKSDEGGLVASRRRDGTTMAHSVYFVNKKHLCYLYRKPGLRNPIAV